MLKAFEDILLFEGITVAMVVPAALAKMEQVGEDMEQGAVFEGDATCPNGHPLVLYTTREKTWHPNDTINYHTKCDGCRRRIADKVQVMACEQCKHYLCNACEHPHTPLKYWLYQMEGRKVMGLSDSNVNGWRDRVRHEVWTKRVAAA